MDIRENISATLKREKEKRGLTFMEFATELGIPRTTLQGYLKVTSHPRADSLEELAKKLDISLAELVSGEDFPRSVGISCLDSILMEIPSLHPHVAPAVQNTVSALQYLFQLSEELYRLNGKQTESEPQELVYKYVLHELQDSFHSAPSYGIMVKQRFPDGWTTVALVAAFSRDKAAVVQLAERCTALQLSPEHLLDVVQDFLTLHAL